MVWALSSESYSIEELAFLHQDFEQQFLEFDSYHAFAPFALSRVLEFSSMVPLSRIQQALDKLEHVTVSNRVPNNQEMVVYQAGVGHELASQHDFEIRVELFCTLLGHATHYDLVSNNVWCVEIGPKYVINRDLFWN